MSVAEMPSDAGRFVETIAADISDVFIGRQDFENAATFYRQAVPIGNAGRFDEIQKEVLPFIIG
jgi:hypothetical protein